MNEKQLATLRHIWVALNSHLNAVGRIANLESDDPHDEANGAYAGLTVVAHELQRFIEQEQTLLRNKKAAKA